MSRIRAFLHLFLSIHDSNEGEAVPVVGLASYTRCRIRGHVVGRILAIRLPSFTFVTPLRCDTCRPGEPAWHQHVLMLSIWFPPTGGIEWELPKVWLVECAS